MKKNLMILALIIVPFLLIGTVSASTSGTTSNYKKVSLVPSNDLVVSQVTAPHKGVKGCSIIVSNTIKNEGKTGSGGFYVNYYLKSSSTSPGRYIGHRYIKGLAGGSINHDNTHLNIPTAMRTGSYYLISLADAGRNITESNENNNYHYSTCKILIVGPMYLTFDNKVGGDVTLNPEINSHIPKTDFACTIFRLEKNGSVMLKFGNGVGPKILISAGIHGNEEEANIAIMKYLEYIKDKNIKGTLYVIPFAIPQDTALKTRYYNGRDPNRIANETGTPGWNIVNFARKNGIKYILDVHSGEGVSYNGLLNINPSSTKSAEYKWASYITKISGCISREQPLEPGMVRTEAFKYGINTITLEVERDTVETISAAETEFNMINAAVRYFGFPNT
jgi:hypothetical protein